ncbi:MAG: bifunctional riboflavin kinase/FAD synthetase [Oscillospiraceae bacterium]
MLLYKKIEQLENKTAIALGLFDGVHLGHKEVIEAAVKFKSSGLKATVFTFDAKCNDSLSAKTSQKIYNLKQKCQLFKNIGVEIVVCPNFDDIKNLEPIDFIEEVLIKKLQADVLVCGYDYHFGKGAKGDIALLQSVANKNNISLIVINKLSVNGEKVSSTKIKQYLIEGNIEDANTLLGYNYYIEKEVVQGIKLGRTLGFPTINQQTDDNNLVVPKNGVYFTLTTIDGKKYKSITNVGIKPTIKGERQPLFETHILGTKEDLYGRFIKVEFLEFLRAEKKFDSLQTLTAAINADRLKVEQKKSSF